MTLLKDETRLRATSVPSLEYYIFDIFIALLLSLLFTLRTVHRSSLGRQPLQTEPSVAVHKAARVGVDLLNEAALLGV